MKKLIYALLFTTCCTSCNFLDTEVYDNPAGDQIYTDETTCMAGLAGVYDALGLSTVYGQNLWGDLDAGTDIMVYNRDYGKGNLTVCMYNFNSTESTLNGAWTGLYTGINRANDFLDQLSRMTDEQCGGSVKKNMFESEAKVLRALFYMNLVAFWGEVPLRITPTKDLTTQLLKKSSQEKIYEQIVSDLLAAEKGCRPANELNASGRISQTTAQALLARAYLWQAGYPVNADTWDDALTYARKVRDSNLHYLYPTEGGVNGYRNLFINMCSNKYDLTARESMFEVEFYGNGLESSNESGKVGLYNGVTQGTATDPDVPFAYGWYDVTKILIRLYEADDARKWWNCADYSFKAVDGKVQKVPSKEADKLTGELKVCPGKWRAEYDPIRPWAKNNSSINFPVMRYSDVLLMIAEASNEVSGPTQEAIDAINLVRERAGATSISLADFDKDKLRQYVFEERTRELCFEVPRRMELRRLGKEFFFSRIALLKSQAWFDEVAKKPIGYDLDDVRAVPAINIAAKHIYLPIPQCEANTNTICGPTTGW